MEVKAIAKYVPIGPRRIRQVIDLIRNRGVDEALAILRFTRKAASEPVEKVLKSALANAGNFPKVNIDKLYIEKTYVDVGPSLKRFRPRAMGRSAQILKRSSHITVVLKERESIKIEKGTKAQRHKGIKER
ncbi:50S ribosomal protein L22 [candidate division NPL-UPA2 bacterium]|nr:50S ribosomal protein L22 [candidate division NPL-UPA2 bacterium]